MIWAIVRANGHFTLHYDDPAGLHPGEVRGAKVWQLPREPDIEHGERIDFVTGSLIFGPGADRPGTGSIAARLVEEIKVEARRRIEEFAPIWKQINDARTAASPESIERTRQIDAVRAWSDQLEARVATAKSVADLRSIRAELAP